MSNKRRDALTHQLEKISQKELKTYRKRHNDISDYFNEHFNYFSGQRKELFGELTDSLVEKCSDYEFTQYQRAIHYKHSDNPLSARGSILNETGGRFNIGNMSPNIPKFAALYLAADKETVQKEFIQADINRSSQGLSGSELALINNDSILIIVVKGRLEKVLDLTGKESLRPFFDLIKQIKLPRELHTKAKRHKLHPYPEVKTVTQLYNSIFESNYQQYSMLFDLPSNSQILGHIAHEAGIHAIKYPSKFTGKHCLAVFPSNFEYSDSSVMIDSETPNSLPENLKMINKDNFLIFS